MTSSQESKNIKVQLLIAGGHEYTIYLPSESPLLQNLFNIILLRTYTQNSANHSLLQIPINGGYSVLCLSSEQLIGIITEPPIFLQTEETPTITNRENPTEKEEILPSHYIQIDNFLTEEDHQKLIKYVIERERGFQSTITTTNDSDYRKSMVLYNFPEFSELILTKIRAIIPNICEKLGIPLFTISNIESQLTAHNHGNYYKIHNDNGSAETATRELTYVYYFCREPKAFTGGELRVYDSKIFNNYYVSAESFQDIEPRNNSIVFFLSRYLHEVLPVNCPSQIFADSRFTINGWIRR